ncbi:chymotrypsin-1-like [Odontomachus brunneus]|uniref:chymotrypsin-1-like n=1 Tax=Odontomachus brunneus TaxID=486640 RepID=UPI0013F29CE5|nr:chymotrypsin-1-like [Odontomachus brunneus]
MTIEMTKLAILLVVVVIAKVYSDEPEPIVGGDVASPGQFPHQVSLQRSKSHICGGTLISDIHILTAAHCIPYQQSQRDRLTVVTGSNNVRIGGQRHEIKCIQVHEDYNPLSRIINNDIALITLKSPIKTSKVQAPIPIASKDYADGNHNAIASGWGNLGLHENMPTMLQYLVVKVLTHKDCQTAHPSNSVNQICTYRDYGQGLCHGDSGGPLICNDQLVGIVSWGKPCAVGEPDVFTNVYTYRAWIKEHQKKC